VEDQDDTESPSDSNDKKSDSGSHMRFFLFIKSGLRILKRVISDISVTLRIILLLAALAFDLYTIVPFLVFTIGAYGLWSILGLIVTQSPIIYLIVEEIWRQAHMLPPSEAFEISPERWKKSVKEYVELVKKKRKTGK
jgi:hypothetical protein